MSPARTPALRRPGPPGDEVLDWQGEQIDGAAFDALCRSVEVAGGVLDVTNLPVPAQLAGVWAAADARVPVLFGNPVHPLPASVRDPAYLPPEAFLVVGTSGTSGSPRAVVRTLASWTESFDAYTALIDLHPGDRVLLTGPLSSTMQLFAGVHALTVGAVVTDDPLRATSAVCVPSALRATLAAAVRLRTAVVAGARLDEAAVVRAQNTGITVVEYYGAAELSFVAARRHDRGLAPLLPFPGVQVQIRDGEIWSRSAFHALGLRGSTGSLRTDDDGFATVADLGSLDGGGLVVGGRGDAAVSVGGRTVLVEDVETALSTIDGVTDAAVVGAPHDRLGQVLVAVVVTAPGVDLADVRRQARAELRDEWSPRRWKRVDALPRTANAKIDRAALRALLTGLA